LALNSIENMKKTNFRKWLALLLLSLGSLAGFQPPVFAQQTPCWLTFPAGSNTATIDIYSPWITGDNIVGNTNASHNPAYFIDTVTTGDAVIPDGTYLGWCLDFNDSIDGFSTSYSTLLFSSCDTNLDAELRAVGLGYPADVYVDPQVWNEINYILNHKNNAYFNDIQIAIWDLIGGPGSLQQIYAGVPPPDNPPFNTNQVN
jgi:hypothetical protein